MEEWGELFAPTDSLGGVGSGEEGEEDWQALAAVPDPSDVGADASPEAGGVEEADEWAALSAPVAPAAASAAAMDLEAWGDTRASEVVTRRGRGRKNPILEAAMARLAAEGRAPQELRGLGPDAPALGRGAVELVREGAAPVEGQASWVVAPIVQSTLALHGVTGFSNPWVLCDHIEDASRAAEQGSTILNRHVVLALDTALDNEGRVLSKRALEGATGVSRRTLTKNMHRVAAILALTER